MSYRALLLLASLCLASPQLTFAAKEKFSRTKPHVNVGTLGDLGLAEIQLSVAIIKVLDMDGMPTAPPLPQLDGAGGGPGVSLRSCRVQYETELRVYAHVDCPGHADYVKNMITGAAQMDGAILVVSAVDGPLPQTQEHVRLARQVGVPAIVTFMNHVDRVDDDELLDLVEAEVRELLTFHQYDGATAPIIRGSALKAYQGDPAHQDAIRRLLDAMDDHIPQPVRPADKPFLMPIEDVFSIMGRGTVATGRVERGTARVGDEVEIVGFQPLPMSARILDFLRLPPRIDAVMPGDQPGMEIEPVLPAEVQRGQVVAAPGSIGAHSRFKAEIYVLQKEEGGRHVPFFNGYRPQFYFRTTDVTGEIHLPDGVPFVMPGDNSPAEIELMTPIALEQGTRFEILDGPRRAGVGVVAEVAMTGMNGGH
jgi:elongation factor Tu